jgi:phosphoribosyl-ATP pyrophosphohydrolase/phosphoribosyl-AMP cyclohydrolase
MPSLKKAFEIICQCRDGKTSHSHIKKALKDGNDRILRKIGEEASEVVMACKDHQHERGNKTHIAEEVGDVLYYLGIVLAKHEVELEQVFEIMWEKRKLEKVELE